MSKSSKKAELCEPNNESAFIKRVSVVLMKHKIVSFKDILVGCFVKLLQAWAVWGEKTSTENMSPSDWPLDKSMTFIGD